MLNNFIYAKTKALFEEALNNSQVPEDAIVFIEDTKEVYTHGTYFAGTPDSFGGILVGNDETSAEDGYIFIDEDDNSSVDVYTTEQIDEKVSNLQPTLIDGENIKTINGESILGSGDLTVEEVTTDSVMSALNAIDRTLMQDNLITEQMNYLNRIPAILYFDANTKALYVDTNLTKLLQL